MKNTHMHGQLESSGERFLPEWGGQSELEHIHRYLYACSISAGKIVLDIACGEGYGSEMLSNSAKKVTGVDISIEAVNYAREQYSNENLEYLVGSCTDIPLPDASVDMVVSFETIEHHDQHEKMMEEIRRVLRPDGFVVISSPDKKNYSDLPSLVNPFHVKELYEQEFKQLVNNYFSHVEYLGQRVISGSCLFSESLLTPITSYVKDKEYIKQVAGIDKPTFWLAIASNARLPQFASGVFENSVNELDTLKLVIADRDSYITHLTQAVNERDGQIISLKTVLVDRDSYIAHLTQAVTDRDGQISSLNQAVTGRDGQISSLNQAMTDRDNQIASLNQAMTERDGQISASTRP